MRQIVKIKTMIWIIQNETDYYYIMRQELVINYPNSALSNNKRTEYGPLQFGSSRERIAAANAANVQYAGQQRVIIITRQTTLGSRTKTFWVIFKKAIVHIV